MNLQRKFYIFILAAFMSNVCFANGKLLATPGLIQVEGSGGGGLIPWAQLASYATEDEIAFSGSCSLTNVDDFELNSCGLQLNFYDRIEVSFARQEFDVDPLSTTISQNIIGAKIRLYGDVVYSALPQISLGIQHKTLLSDDVAFSLGASKNSGSDVYLAVSKLHVGLVAGYNFLWNATLRYTEANELGLLGFGGEQGNGSLQTEISAALLVSQHVAVGFEYRKKPDNLGLAETAWKDFFITWFPNKHLNFTLAYVDLGTIAALPDQQGSYASITGYF